MSANTVLHRASVICTVLVVIGVFELPYGYYTLLRIGLCGAAIAVIFLAYDSLSEVSRWLFGAIAVLYNPIIPIYLGDKSVWIVLNVLTVLVFWFIFGMVHRSSRPTSE